MTTSSEAARPTLPMPGSACDSSLVADIWHVKLRVVVVPNIPFSRRIYLRYLLTVQCSVFRPPVLHAMLNLDVSVQYNHICSGRWYSTTGPLSYCSPAAPACLRGWTSL